MELILLAIGTKCLISHKHKKELEECLYDFFYTTKDIVKPGLNDDKSKRDYNVVVTGINEHFISGFDYELPESWIKIRKFILDKLFKDYPNYTSYENNTSIVSKEFTVYNSKNFKIVVRTRLVIDPKFVVDRPPYHRIDKIKIINRNY